MKRKPYINRKGINPALLQMSEQQKAATYIDAANKAHKLLTDKVLHDVFGFGPEHRRDFAKSTKSRWSYMNAATGRMKRCWNWQRTTGGNERCLRGSRA